MSFTVVKPVLKAIDIVVIVAQNAMCN